MLKDKVFFISIILLILMSIGAVSASDQLLEDNCLNENIGNENINVNDVSVGESGDHISDSSDYVSDSSDYVSDSSDYVSDSSDYVSDSGEIGDSVENLQSDDINQTAVKTFEDIQSKVNNAKANATIKLNGLYIGSGNEIKINKNLTFIGTNNTVLDAKNMSRIFNIHADNVVIKNIKFINAFSKTNDNVTDAFGCGGVILQCGKKLAVSNCCFENNYANVTGSVIYHINAKYTFEDVGIYSVSYKAIESSISNCNFTNNHADDGMLSFENEKGFSKIKNCIFKNNTAYTVVQSSNGTIINSKFLNNVGISIDVAYIYLSHESDYKKYNLLIKNCSFKNNRNDFSIIRNELVCSIVDCSFKNNTSKKLLTIYSDRILTITKKNNTRKFNDLGFYDSAHLFDDSLKAYRAVVLEAKGVTANYKNQKFFTVKLYNGLTRKGIKARIDIRIYTGKKYKTYTRHTNKSGILKFNISSLAAGKHKVIVYYMEDSGMEYYVARKIKSSIKIKKLATVVKAPKVTKRYKKSKYFKVSVKLKSTKKPLNKFKVKLRIYTGKKYKTYTIKTNKKGIAKFNTKKLKRGKHKVVLLSGNSNYKLSGKTSIRIK